MPDRFASVLLIHGAGGGGWEWNVWRDVFEAAGVRVESPDLMPVAAGIEATRLQDYREQMAAALERLPRPRAVVGASLGGLIAAMLAPQADALIVVNPLPPAPWHAELPTRAWPDRVPWRQEGRLVSTRRAMPDADAASALFAFRHWRDESGAVLREASAGVAVAAPTVPTLWLASDGDDLPKPTSLEAARAWRAELRQLRASSHVGPLLGREAAAAAAAAAAWLSAS